MGKLRVLNVEDNEADSLLLALELRRLGYDADFERVDTAPAMRSALAGGGFDIVLSDFTIPGFGALPALDIVRELKLDLPFIIVSGSIGEETAVNAMRAGAHDFLIKGQLARLPTVLDRELREARVRVEGREMKQRLLVAERMAAVGTLVAGIAHEINNPLAALVVNLELLQAALPPGGVLGDAAMALDEAHQAADRVRGIVRHLKVFSHAGDAEMRGAVDVHRVLESSLRMAANEIRHRARLTKNYAESAWVDGSEGRLGQVFLNLIINAAQAIRDGHIADNELRVETAVVADELRVTIADTGAGIDAQTLPRIFEPFFTTKPRGSGVGLGLAICQQIVSEHGGDITVTSEAGRGTTFVVSLPLAEAPTAVAVQPIVGGEPPVRPGRILVVDDEPAIGAGVLRSLSPPHVVLTTTSAVEALRRLGAGERFDLIICDLMMPEMTGVELYAQLARNAPNLAARLVFMTGGAFSPEAAEFFARIENPRIEKPFSIRALRKLVADALAVRA